MTPVAKALSTDAVSAPKSATRSQSEYGDLSGALSHAMASTMRAVFCNVQR